MKEQDCLISAFFIRNSLSETWRGIDTRRGKVNPRVTAPAFLKPVTLGYINDPSDHHTFSFSQLNNDDVNDTTFPSHYTQDLP